MKPFTKVVMPGTKPFFWGSGERQEKVFVKIQWNGRDLSLTGVEAPLKSGNARGSCGQIGLSRTGPDGMTPAKGWTLDLIQLLSEVWKRWHLNDLQAGCWHQRLLGWATNGQLSKPCPVCGYKYGTAWLREEVPQEVLDFLRSLPDSPVKPAWV